MGFPIWVFLSFGAYGCPKRQNCCGLCVDTSTWDAGGSNVGLPCSYSPTVHLLYFGVIRRDRLHSLVSTFERQLRLSNLETKLESHVQRRGSGYNGQRMLNTELPDRRKRRPSEETRGGIYTGHTECWCDRGGC